jgi:hypothetical protein
MTDLLKRVLPLLAAILLAVFPLLSLFAQNQTEIELSVLWLPLALSVAAAALLYGVFLAITRRPDKASALTSLALVAFFYYGLFPVSGSRLFLAAWLCFLGLVAVVVLRTRRDLFAVTVLVAVAGAVMALPQAANIVIYQVRHPPVSAADPRLWPTALAKPAVAPGTRLPDIYVLIPDDYARFDVLRTYFHYDDSTFVQGLKSRGFVVSTESRSPYSDSESNIASLLNMDYLTNFPRVLGADSQDVRPVKRVMEDSRAARLLGSVGYDYVHLDTDEVTFAGGNPDISPLAPPDSFMNLWLRKSILLQVGGKLGFTEGATNARFRSAIGAVFQQLDPPQHNKPRFVVFHTLLPHDPYVYDAQGRPVTFPGHSDEDLSSPMGRAYYVHQLVFLQRKLLTSIDQILAHTSTDPVIVLQADEGFQAAPEDFGEAQMQDIRVKGLSAFHLPGPAPAEVPQPPNSVNNLRFVFNQYLGTHYDLLKSASYPEGDLPYDFQEMTVQGAR